MLQITTCGELIKMVNSIESSFSYPKNAKNEAHILAILSNIQDLVKVSKIKFAQVILLVVVKNTCIYLTCSFFVAIFKIPIWPYLTHAESNHTSSLAELVWFDAELIYSKRVCL